MTTDIDRIQGGCRDLHDIWANVIEAGLASWLLETELGFAFLAPIVVVIICVTVSLLFGKITGKRQGAWMKKIQKRVSFTANTISNMTGLKMSGLAHQNEWPHARFEDRRIEVCESISYARGFLDSHCVHTSTVDVGHHVRNHESPSRHR